MAGVRTRVEVTKDSLYNSDDCRPEERRVIVGRHLNIRLSSSDRPSVHVV